MATSWAGESCCSCWWEEEAGDGADRVAGNGGGVVAIPVHQEDGHVVGEEGELPGEGDKGLPGSSSSGDDCSARTQRSKMSITNQLCQYYTLKGYWSLGELYTSI